MWNPPVNSVTKTLQKKMLIPNSYLALLLVQLVWYASQPPTQWNYSLNRAGIHDTPHIPHWQKKKKNYINLYFNQSKKVTRKSNPLVHSPCPISVLFSLAVPSAAPDYCHPFFSWFYRIEEWVRAREMGFFCRCVCVWFCSHKLQRLRMGGCSKLTRRYLNVTALLCSDLCCHWWGTFQEAASHTQNKASQPPPQLCELTFKHRPCSAWSLCLVLSTVA